MDKNNKACQRLWALELLDSPGHSRRTQQNPLSTPASTLRTPPDELSQAYPEVWLDQMQVEKAQLPVVDLRGISEVSVLPAASLDSRRVNMLEVAE